MAKNQASSAHRNGALRDRSNASGSFAKRDANSGRFVGQKRSKGTRREILFPTEPSTIGNEKIDRAIDLVISRKK